MSVAPTNKPDSDKIRFDIQASNVWQPDVIGDNTPQTASVVTRSEMLLMDCEGETALPEDIYIYMEEEDCPTVIDTCVMTKGDGDPVALYGIYAYHTTDAESLFMNNLPFYSNGTYQNQDSYFWPGTGTMQFYVYSPYDESSEDNYSINNVNGTLSISYTVPTTIADQKDLMAGVSAQIEDYQVDPVSINLQHLLSKIQVKKSTDCGEIVAIALNGVYNTGTYTLKGTNLGWSVATSATNPKSNYTQGTTEGTTTTALGINSENIVGAPMYLLPQTLPEDATIQVRIRVPKSTDDTGDDRYYTLTKNLSDLTSVWNSDKMYTFVISTPEEIEIEISDNVVLVGENVVKKDLVIKNVGMSAAYIRATITGAWMLDSDDKSFVVANWDSENDGVFEDLCPDSHWVKGTDGYYYYKGLVERGTTLEPLFDSYTLTAEAPMAKAYLEMNIYVQAVLPGDVESSWPVAANAINL